MHFPPPPHGIKGICLTDKNTYRYNNIHPPPLYWSQTTWRVNKVHRSFILTNDEFWRSLFNHHHRVIITHFNLLIGIWEIFILYSEVLITWHCLSVLFFFSFWWCTSIHQSHNVTPCTHPESKSSPAPCGSHFASDVITHPLSSSRPLSSRYLCTVKFMIKQTGIP